MQHTFEADPLTCAILCCFPELKAQMAVVQLQLFGDQTMQTYGNFEGSNPYSSILFGLLSYNDPRISQRSRPFGTGSTQICRFAPRARPSPEKKSWERKRGAFFAGWENAVGKTRVVWVAIVFFSFWMHIICKKTLQKLTGCS